MITNSVGLIRFLPRLGVFCLLGWLLSGCASMPRTVDVPIDEEMRATAAFEKVCLRQESCRCCIDVAVDVTLKGLMHSGTVSGYLQAMSPAFLKFGGLNPLGQPLMILVSDGVKFQYLAVDQGKGYSGSVDAKTFVKYAPSGFRPQESFYWLTDRLPPGDVVVENVARAVDGEGYWLTVRLGSEQRRLLFDPLVGVFLRHQMLNSEGDVLFEATYEDFRAGEEMECLLPGRIVVTASKHRGTLVVELKDWFDDAALSEKDFKFVSPQGFELVEVP